VSIWPCVSIWIRAARRVAAALLSFACAACCPVEIDLGERDDGRQSPPADDAPRLDLGDAQYPSKNSTKPVDHPWWVPKLDPKQYTLGYQLPRKAADDIRDTYRAYARKVRHKRISKDRFQWVPPPSCIGGLHCVYQELTEQDDEAIKPIAELFRKRAREAKLSALDAAALIITFAQEIHYRIPDKEPFGVLPPALVAKQSWGDCDSKALLALMILRRLGIHSVLISSKAHKHTMLGLALPAPGSSFNWNGRRYAFVELTAKRAPIGYIHPKLLRPNDWSVERMDYRPGRYDVGTPDDEPDATAPDRDDKRTQEPKPKPRRKKKKKRRRVDASKLIGGYIRIN
jgi:hypothetical protein